MRTDSGREGWGQLAVLAAVPVLVIVVGAAHKVYQMAEAALPWETSADWPWYQLWPDALFLGLLVGLYVFGWRMIGRAL